MSDQTLSKELKRVIRKFKPTRKELENAMREVRRDKSIEQIIGKPKKQSGRKLPVLPSSHQIQALLGALEKDGKLLYRMIVKMFLYTGLRNSEVRALKIEDIDLSRNQIIVREGKGKKDRRVPIFREYRETLLMYLNSVPRNRYLFENRFGGQFSDSYVRRIFREYCTKAGLPRIHPHLIRHYFITYLTKMGWTDEQIMLITGHDSKESLKIYQHLALPDIEKKFQDDMKDYE